MFSIKYFVNDKTRTCRMDNDPNAVKSAEADGYRQVTVAGIEAFQAETKKAVDAGWDKDKISYAKFMAAHPELSPAAETATNE